MAQPRMIDKSEVFSILAVPIMNVSNNQCALFIPGYQRPYVWQTERVLDLLDDLWQASGTVTEQTANRGYFLGSIVLAPHLPKKVSLGRFVQYDLVDGQQRLTTLSIIAAALHSVTAEYDDQAENDEISEKFAMGRKELENALQCEYGVKKVVTHLIMRPDDRAAQNAWDNLARTDNRQQNESYQVHDLNSLYGRNYKAIREQLLSYTADMADQEETRTKLAMFLEFLVTRVQVMVMVASDELGALQIFGVVNTPGEALDVSSMMKWQLLTAFKEKDGEESHDADRLEAIWAESESHLGSRMEEMVMSAIRSWCQTYDLDATNIPGIAREAVDSAGPDVYTNQLATKGMPREALLSKYFEDAFGITRRFRDIPLDASSFGQIDAEISRLLLLLSVATGTGDARSKVALVLPVMFASLMAVGVRGADAMSIESFTGSPTQKQVLSVVFTNLEAILIHSCLCRHTKKHLKEKMEAALGGAWRLRLPAQDAGAAVLPAELELTRDEQRELIGAVNGKLYGSSGLREVAMRHIVMRANILEEQVFRKRTTSRITRSAQFRTEWSVEHIHAQAFGDHEFFSVDNDHVHRLGNLAPIETDLNSKAGNRPFFQKKSDAYKHSAFHTLSQLAAGDNEFGKSEFQTRQALLLGLLCDDWGIDRAVLAGVASSDPDGGDDPRDGKAGKTGAKAGSSAGVASNGGSSKADGKVDEKKSQAGGSSNPDKSTNASQGELKGEKPLVCPFDVPPTQVTRELYCQAVLWDKARGKTFFEVEDKMDLWDRLGRSEVAWPSLRVRAREHFALFKGQLPPDDEINNESDDAGSDDGAMDVQPAEGDGAEESGSSDEKIECPFDVPIGRLTRDLYGKALNWDEARGVATVDIEDKLARWDNGGGTVAVKGSWQALRIRARECFQECHGVLADDSDGDNSDEDEEEQEEEKKEKDDEGKGKETVKTGTKPVCQFDVPPGQLTRETYLEALKWDKARGLSEVDIEDKLRDYKNNGVPNSSWQLLRKRARECFQENDGQLPRPKK